MEDRNITVFDFYAHPTAKIGKNVVIKCDRFRLGANSIIKDNCKITCTSFEAGDGLFMAEGVEVGRGGSFGPNSKVTIGTNVGIFERTIINPSEEVTIGNNVGIGAEVMIWTHGAWLDSTKGFPADFGPVHIEENVWLPARCIILPNVSIGKNTVIGIGSILNKSIPEGSLAAGNPCRVIKGDYYPKNLSLEQIEKLVLGILHDWGELIEFKVGSKYNYSVSYNKDKTRIELLQVGEKHTGTVSTLYNVVDKTIEGFINELSEDLRDYLRRRGIKIHTNKNFKSI